MVKTRKMEELIVGYFKEERYRQACLSLPEGDAEQSPPEPEEVQRELRDVQRKKQAKRLGMTQKEDGRVHFNANQCVEYLQNACDIANLDATLYIYNRLSGLWEELKDELLGMLLMFLMNTAIPKSWHSHYEKEVLEGLQRSTPRVLNKQGSENLIPLENGVYDLFQKALREYTPEDWFQSKIPVTYNETAKCPTFFKTVEEIFENDEERVAVMQEIFGNAILNSSKSEKMFLWSGMGSNGKSLLGDILTAVVGHDNTSHVPLSRFGETFGLEPIVGKMLNISAENEVTKRLHTEYLKAMASGDAISIPRKFKTAITVKQTTTLVFLLNTLPDIGDLTHGFQRKLLIVPFDHIFLAEEMDKQRKAKILPKELSGILNWAIEGALRLIDNGFEFTDSKKIKEITVQYEAEQNPVKSFFHEVLKEEAGQRISRKQLLRYYKAWLQGQGITANGTDSEQRFWKLLNQAAILEGKPKPSYPKIKGYRYLADYGVRWEALPKSAAEEHSSFHNNTRIMEG